MDSDQIARNLQAQRDLYGEPLGEVFRRAMTAFDLTQGKLAATIGLSAPMLSQLSSGQRVKIGNPAVLQRIEALAALAEDIETGKVPPESVPARLAEVRAVTGRLTRTDEHSGPEDLDEEVVTALRGLLRAVASGQQLQSAAQALHSDHPAIAELLTVYGLGPRTEALAHLRHQRPLF